MFIYTVGDIIALIAIALLASIFAIYFGYYYIKQKFCKHRKTYTNQLSLDEHCYNCSKNLGFVGRDK